jgi:betaine-aldehyde dehydrogenase
VAELAARGLKRVTLELGGKAPLIVFADADLDAAAQGAVVAGCINSGQDCTAATRLYVHASVREPFTQRLLAAARAVRVGDPRDMRTDMGPLASAEHRQRVHAFVQEEHARVLLGGVLPTGRGYFYPPTIIADPPQTARCVQEEIFGPVMTLNSFGMHHFL